MTVKYDPTAAIRLLNRDSLDEINVAVINARDEVLRDVDLLKSSDDIPTEKLPLDAGFIDLPQQLLSTSDSGLLTQIQTAASSLRENVDNIVLLGIGGSYMGMRALFEALRHPYHNQLSRVQRHHIPRLYFEGNNLDNDSIVALLELLRAQCGDKSDPAQRWGIIVISKSGGTIETAVSFRLFRQAVVEYYGEDSDELKKLIVAVTGETGKLRDVANEAGYEFVFPIPDDVGGRFSIFTPVGLAPAASLGVNIERLLQGAADMTETFRTAPCGSNPVLDYVATCHAFERDNGLNIRILSTWGTRLEAAGLWYDQLLSESLGKAERGATPITAVNSRDLHSRGQQHQEGTRDKLITNVIVENPSTESITIPRLDDDQDQLNQHARKSIPQLLSAAFNGTNRAYADEDRPTADILLPRIDEYEMGQLFQMLMLATVVEGRLIGINPYGQPGVEAYKRNMTQILSAQSPQ